MTATDRLRALLDERGAEYETDDHMGFSETRWGGTYAFQLAPGAALVMAVTPEQAVDATLGRGECRMDAYTDAAFRVVAAPDETDYVDYANVCECSACGADVIIPHEYERVTAGDDRLWPAYNYCPCCGRKVVA